MNDAPTPRPDDAASFGPGGYLPDRAARRARKIVLREPMGLGWPLAAGAAGVFLAAVGLVVLVLATRQPGPPFTPLVSADQLDAPAVTRHPVGGPVGEVLLVRAATGVRAYAAPQEDIRYCRTSRRLEGSAASVWRLDGQRVGGRAPSLVPVEIRVHDGVVYASTDRPSRPALPPAAADEQPVCT